MDVSRNTSYQNLILYMLRYIHEREYMRSGDYCARKIFTKCGRFTRAYEDKIKIKDLVYEACKKEVNWDMWHNMTVQKDNAANVTKHLTSAMDTEFQDLKPDRQVFSFANGIYRTCVDKDKCLDEFIPYADAGKLDSRVISVSYTHLTLPTILRV